MYTSPICEGNIPITHFTFQEPADDPKAYCYIWVSYSHDRLFRPGLPFAVLYSFLFGKKMFLKGCGNIYEVRKPRQTFLEFLQFIFRIFIIAQSDFNLSWETRNHQHVVPRLKGAFAWGFDPSTSVFQIKINIL